MPEGQQEEVEIPPMVTFTSGAELLIALKVVPSITREGVRKIAKTDPTWPFGPGREHAYVKIGNAQGMATEPFLSFFRGRSVRGRGPDAQPRKRREQRPATEE